MKQMKFRNANMFGKVGANLSRIPHRALESYPMKWLEHIFQRRARNQVVSSPRASVRRSPLPPNCLRALPSHLCCMISYILLPCTHPPSLFASVFPKVCSTYPSIDLLPLLLLLLLLLAMLPLAQRLSLNPAMPVLRSSKAR